MTFFPADCYIGTSTYVNISMQFDILISGIISKSLVNFLMDPTGDIPWEEEPTAGDVVHVETPEVCLVIFDINLVSVNQQVN